MSQRGNALQTGWRMTRNQDLKVLHVSNASAFAASLPTRMVAGDTLIFDFIYFLHPVASLLGCQVQLWLRLDCFVPSLSLYVCAFVL